MMQNLKKKVCLIVDCLGGGGAERAAAALSTKLFENNYDVFIISLRDEIVYSFSGTLFNLGINESKFKLKKQFYKFQSFKKTYKAIEADIYIDFRMRNRVFMEWLFHKFVFDMGKMIMAIRSYNIFYHIPKHNFFYKEYSTSIAIVGVTKDICKRLNQVYDFKNLVSIPNFYKKQLSINASTKKTLFNGSPFVLAVGRLDNEVKQFDKLILAYKKSVLFSRKIPLLIIGEGKDRVFLESLIAQLKLQDNVKLLGFKDDVYDYMKTAMFLMLCSKFEGFPNVILESLVLGTPVVSFNCKSGPSEMIIDGENGILVEDQNFNAFREAMNKMMNDSKFYKNCKSNASSSVAKFTEDFVAKKWIELVESSC